MAVKSDIKSRDQRFKGFDLGSREIGTRTSYAVVTYFHYKRQNFVNPSNVSDFKPSFDVEVGTIDTEIAEISVSKSISQCSGNFTLSLFPSKNWKQILSPGDWVMIYFFNEFDKPEIIKDTRNCVLIGNIDRISRSLSRNEDEDKTQLRYNVSGRNFGKVFEEQDIWFDPYATSASGGLKSELDVYLQEAGLTISGTPKDIVDALIGIFLGKGGKTDQGKKDGISGWNIPIALASRFQATTPSSAQPQFFDILNSQIDKLPGYKAREALTVDSNGSLWDMIERNSNPLVNEVFLEESREADGTVRPTIFLKPRPLQTPFFEDFFNNAKAATTAAIKKAKGNQEQISVSERADLSILEGAYQSLQNLAKTNYVEVAQSEIKFEDLGKDDHSRMNFFWLRTPQAFENNYRYNANLNATKGFNNPVYSRESIQRHGLKRMDQTFDFCYVKEGQLSGVQINLWKAFMAQIYDTHFAAHLFEAGTIECTGVLEAELGKALIVKAARKGELDKVFFIEGYEHSWSLQEGWTTTFTLTHGQWLTDGKNIFVDATPEDFGQLDEALTSTYLAKTESER